MTTQEGRQMFQDRSNPVRVEPDPRVERGRAMRRRSGRVDPLATTRSRRSLDAESEPPTRDRPA